MSDEVMEIGFDEFQGLYDETEAMLEAATSFANIGKLNTYTTAHIWRVEAGVTQVGAQEWRNFNPVRYESSKFLSLHVCLDLQEFDSSIPFKYEKFIAVNGGSSWVDVNGDGEKQEFKSDWVVTWEPSVKETLGKQYQDMSQALRFLQGKYVKVLNVKQQPTKKNPVPADNYTTPKLVEVYESREVAYAAYQQLRGSGVTTSAATKEYDATIEDAVRTIRALFANDTFEELATRIGGGLTGIDVKTILGV